MSHSSALFRNRIEATEDLCMHVKISEIATTTKTRIRQSEYSLSIALISPWKFVELYSTALKEVNDTNHVSVPYLSESLCTWKLLKSRKTTANSKKSLCTNLIDCILWTKSKQTKPIKYSLTEALCRWKSLKFRKGRKAGVLAAWMEPCSNLIV